MSPQEQSILVRILRYAFLFAISAAAIAASLALTYYFMTHRPKAARQAPPEAAALVQVSTAQTGIHAVRVRALGTVIPAVEITLQPRVQGEVVEIHPSFLEGGVVKAGEVLVRLESVDYQLAVVQQEARLENARYQYKAELGQQAVAKREWELLDLRNPSELDHELALRQPQLRNTQAEVKAQEASLQQAQLNLARTTIEAPGNATILSAGVDVGDIATPQTVLATMAGTDTYWVRALVPVDDLRWLDLPENPADASSRAHLTTLRGTEREGRVISVLGDLEREGSMARLLIVVDDPLCLQGGDCAPLFLGEYVRAAIDGITVEAIAVPRNTVRNGAEVWAVSPEDTLHILPVEVAWSDEEVALIHGVENGAQLVISDLAEPVEGMPLQVETDTAANPASPQDTAETVTAPQEARS